MNVRRRLLAALLLALGAVPTACGGGSTTPGQPYETFVVNSIDLDVAITLDGVDKGVLRSGAIQPLELGPGDHKLHYSALKSSRMYDGVYGKTGASDPISETVTIHQDDPSVGIDNIVGNDTYFEVEVANGAIPVTPVDVAYFGAGQRRCLGTAEFGYSWFGYFKLTADAEIRYYRGHTACTGSYKSVDHNRLSHFENGARGDVLVYVDTDGLQ